MPRVPWIHRRLSVEVPEDLFYRPQSGLGAIGGNEVCFRWLGAAGFEIEAKGERLLLDPFISRPTLSQTIFRPLVPDDQAVRQRVETADLIVAGHSHHDHAMDIGALAKATGARILGSESALRLARIDGVPEELLSLVAPDDVFEQGPFRGRVLRSVHGKVFAGRIPFPGVISRENGPLRLPQFRVGASFGLYFEACGVRFFHLGSADFVEAALHDVECDVLLLCIVGRQGSKDFTRRILQTLRPKVVLPCHWDNFFLPYSCPAHVLKRVELEAFFEEVEAAGTGTELALLDFFGEYRYSSNSEAAC